MVGHVNPSGVYPWTPVLNNPLQLLNISTYVVASSDFCLGFFSLAETWNGRLAMLALVIGLGTSGWAYSCC
jgi:hypothetical protein